MNAIWNGVVSFGLVHVPVRLHSAAEVRDADLHPVHSTDRGRIRHQRRCEICDEVVTPADIDCVFVDVEGTTVLTKEDLAAIPQEKSREIVVVEFVPGEQIDPLLFERTYYLEPTGKTTKSYVLLRRTLQTSALTAIVKLAIHQRTRLAALRVCGKVIALQTLLRPDEVVDPAFPTLDDDVRISASEQRLSRSLAKIQSHNFDPEQFSGEYQKQLRTLVDAKRRSGDSYNPDDAFGRADHGGTEAVDLSQALKRSVARARAVKRIRRRSDK